MDRQPYPAFHCGTNHIHNMTRNFYEDQTWELTLSDMQGLLGPGNLLTPEQVESLSSSHKTMNVGNYNVRLTIAELADEFNYITHVDYTVLVWRYGREMAMRGEGVRMAEFKEDGELIRYIECRCQTCMLAACIPLLARVYYACRDMGRRPIFGDGTITPQESISELVRRVGSRPRRVGIARIIIMRPQYKDLVRFGTITEYASPMRRKF